MPTSRVGLNVYTWGTTNYGDGATDYSRGMTSATQSIVWGGNVGHASLLLTLADTKENRALVETYLSDTDIPIEYKTYQTKKIIYQKSGESEMSDENAYEENVIEIYFSWWPDNKNDSYKFSSFLQDCEQERSGLDVPYDSRWREYLAPTLEKAPWGIGQFINPIITLGPGLTTHEKKLSQSELRVLRAYQQAYKNKMRINSSLLILHDLNEKKEKNENFSISASEISIMKNVFPNVDWENMDKEKCLEALNREIENLFNANILTIYNYTKALVQMKDPQAQDEVLLKLENEFKSIKHRVKNMKSLHQKLNKCNIVLSTQEERAEISKLIKADKELEERFPKGVTASNYHEMLQFVQFELDSKNPDTIMADYQARYHKLDLMIRLSESIENIESTKHLLYKISLYEKAQGSEKEKLKSKISKAIRSNPDLKEFKTPHIKTMDQKYLAALKAKLKALLTPPDSVYYKSFGQVINSPYGNIVADLEQENALMLLEHSRTQGTPPSHSTTLPLKSKEREGLDPEAMIKKMAEFANQGEKFNLLNNNCAVTSSEILAQGASKNKQIFQQRALNMIATPQMVYNNATQYTGVLNKQNAQKRRSVKFTYTYKEDVPSYEYINLEPPDKHHRSRRRRGN